MQNSDDTQKRDNKTDRRDILLILAAIYSGVFLAGIGIILFYGPFPTGNKLYAYYFLYSVLVVVFLHTAFFMWNRFHQDTYGRNISRNIPRYLEYVYAFLLSLGLSQVFFMPSHFADYIAFVAGDEVSIAQRMQQQALSHLSNDCPRRDEFFTPEYCAKMKALADSDNPLDYIVKNVLSDTEFLRHTIRKEGRGGGPFGSVAIMNIVSPIWQESVALTARREYAALPHTSLRSKAFAWFAFMLLPVGIGLRILKTSLELFGNLA